MRIHPPRFAHRPTRVLLLAAALATFLAISTAHAQDPSNSAPPGNPTVGAIVFNSEFPRVHGNARTCATCHVPEESFQLTPENVESRFQALQQRRLTDPSADDALFRSIDANDGAEDFTNLRQHALVRVIIPLPVDANGQKLVWPVDDPEATHVGVWRAVPSVLNTAFTAPYQQDGRQPTLQSQAFGALLDHAEITVAPIPRFLDDVAAFQKSLFSSPSVEALALALEFGGPLPPTDPPLNELEQIGKAHFQRHCTTCHGGPTQTVPIPALPPGVRNLRISKPLPPFAADLPFAPSPVEPRLWAFHVPGQAPVILPSTDPGQALVTGDRNRFNFFDIPPLYGISRTAPYFHDNSAPTLEAMLRHYQLDFIAIRRILPPDGPRPSLLLDEELPALIAYLKKL